MSSNHRRPMSHSLSAGPGESPSLLFPHSSPSGPLQSARNCNSREHHARREAVNIPVTETCITCALDYVVATILDLKPNDLSIGRMMSWALEQAATGPKRAEELAVCAIEDPLLFRGMWYLASLKAFKEQFDEALKDIRTVYSSLTAVFSRHPDPELNVSIERTGSVLAVMEEMGR